MNARHNVLTINELISPAAGELSEEELAMVMGGEHGYAQTMGALGSGAVALGASIAGSSAVGEAAVTLAAAAGIVATAPEIAVVVAGAGLIALGSASLSYLGGFVASHTH